MEELTFDIDAANEAVKVGERTRVLFELLLDELGCSYETHRNDVWAKLYQVQIDYQQAITNLTTVIKERHTGGVS